MCCGCGGTPTFVACSAINCGGVDVLTCNLPQVYRIDVTGFSIPSCYPAGTTYTAGYLGLVACYNWQNLHPDNPEYPNPGECGTRPNLCDVLGVVPGWGFAMWYLCSGNYAGSYLLTEDCLIVNCSFGSGGSSANGYWACPIAGYNCTGANIFDLVSATGSESGGLPASITLVPAPTPTCAVGLYS